MEAKKENQNKAGRKTVITKEVVAKLEEALKNGFTVRKACELASISKDAYYDETERNPVFSDKMEKAKLWVSELARRNIVKEIRKGNINLSKWWLERKEKVEFSNLNIKIGKDRDEEPTVSVIEFIGCDCQKDEIDGLNKTYKGL